ncbi:MAG TPA: hypothetical protein VMF06_03805 [Candidatus Limnocylindria bacterium]|jgi:hypothetical protein|nr:hypothetical protein [Candidatus Limnocylindria bacterium]
MNSQGIFRLAPVFVSVALLQLPACRIYAQDAPPTPPVPVAVPGAAPVPDNGPVPVPAEIAPPSALPTPTIVDTEIPGGDAPTPKGRNGGADVVKRSKDEAKRAKEDARRKGEQARERSEQARERSESHEFTLAGEGGGMALDVDAFRAQADKQVAELRKQMVGMRGLFSSGTNRRTLVLPTGTTDPQALAQTHEDLVVMHRLLTRALSGSKNNPKEYAFRFNSDDRQVDAMYLAGYGTVFLLNVDFPLVETPKVEHKAPEAEAKDPAWEKERRRASGDDPDDGAAVNFEVNDDGRNGPPDFDAEKVNRLRNRLLEALKHAANIRTLKPEEDVIVVVAGRSQPAIVTRINNQIRLTEPAVVGVAPAKPAAGNAAWSGAAMNYNRAVAPESTVALIASDRGSQSSLVLRVKKSVVDDLAAGKLDADGFKNAVNIIAQPGEPGGRVLQPVRK